MTYRARWDVGLAAGLSAGLLGVLLGSATVVAAGVVGLTFAAYGYATRPPDANVRVARAVSNESPAPGADVDVTLTVRNASDGPLAELRIVDEPPEELPVVEGTPAICTSLAAAETATVEYTVRARRGSHAFGDISVLARNVSGTVEHGQAVDLTSEISCRVGLEELPLASQTTPYAGRVDADAPGEGVSFHSTRQFRPSDPMHRIDWKRYAKDRELTTVQYQESRAATVVMLVDARWEMRVARRAGEHDAAEYCAFAAARVAGVQLDASNRVGAALYGRPTYLRPGVGRDQGLRVRAFLEDALADDGGDGLFDTDQVFFGNVERPTAAGDGGQAAPDGGRPADDDPTWLDPNASRDETGPAGWSLKWLTRRLPEEAQVVFCTPLLDDRAANTARKLDARGHAVRVISPDVTTDETPGALMARIERRQRLRTLRAELPLIEWAPEEALAAAVDRSTEGWT